MRNTFALMLLALLWASGCSSFGRTTESGEKIPEATVEVGEIEFEHAPASSGCASSIEELPDSHVYQKTNPYLQSDHLIVVLKEARRLMLFQDGKLRHDRAGGAPDCWRIGLGVYSDGRSSGDFDKLAQGDRHTPIGLFRVSDKPWSNFYGAILVHYPSERHAAQALRAERITKSTHDQIVSALKKGKLPPQGTALGGDILIHGGGSSSDWTWGCVALNNQDIDELRGLLPKGMKTWVLILP